MRWLAIHLPHLPLEVFSRGDASRQPRVISSGNGRDAVVFCCDCRARAGGVHTGMRISAARALLGSLQVHARDEQLELAALECLAAWAGRITPAISLDPPRGLLLDVAASLRLFGGAGRLREQVCQGLAELGYEARLALAPTPLGAMLLARAGEGDGIADARALRARLRELPLEWLVSRDRDLKVLRGMGLRLVGDLLRLPRDGLARRFGAEVLRTLDRALGRAPDPRALYEPPPRFKTSLVLPREATTVAALLFAARRLLLELAGVLQARDRGVRRMVWELMHDPGQVTRFGLGLVESTRDPEHLLVLLQERLERVRLPAPAQEIGLAVAEMEPLVAPTRDLFPERTGAQAQDWLRLPEHLCARLGMDAVSGVCPVQDHRPERAWREIKGVRPLFCLGEKSQKRGLTPFISSRPVWLLAAPVLLEAANNQPFLNGALVLQGEGERIETGWWDGAEVARDYYLARNPRGSCFWIFNELRGGQRWFLHGIFE